ncbi:cation transporter [Candidatus Sumerlaeota bacterium]|nr:cation transporter [Candidatus Sumerlaeota bacterium]
MREKNDQRKKRDSAVTATLLGIFVINVVVTAFKLVAGYLSGSLALIGDGFHSIGDAGANIVGLIGLKISMLPADDSHPYGHRKFESAASLAIAVMLIISAWEIMQSIIRRFVDESADHIHADPWVFGVVLGTIVINIGITVYERRQGKLHNSPILIADSYHTLTDVFNSFLALAAIAASLYGILWLDLVAAVIIVMLVLRAAWDILRKESVTLLDGARLEADDIRGLVMAVPNVSDCHDIRSRGTENEIWVDLHIVVPPDISAQETYDVEKQVRDRLKAVFPQIETVYIHHQTHEAGAGSDSHSVPAHR